MTPEERRRGIEVALEHRPELELEELRRLLAKVGVEVDEATLIEDLDALGYDVDDEVPAGAVPLDDEGVGSAPVDPTAGPPAPDAPTHDDAPSDDASSDDADDDAPSDDGDDQVDESRPHDAAGDADLDPADEVRPGTRSRRVLVVVAAAVLAVVAIAIAIVVAVGGDDADDTAATGDPDAVGVAQDGGADATTEPRPPAPVGPGSDPALDGPGTLTDDFERGDIGDFPGVGTWEVLRGYFANTDGNLDVLGPPADGVVVAAVDVGSADVRAQVQIDRPASHAGIAFRIVDEENMFVWARVPERGSVVLYEVVDGVATPVVESGEVPVGDGMPVLGINVVGDTVELLHEGAVVATYDELPPGDGLTRIGLALLAGGEGLPLFDELRVQTP